MAKKHPISDTLSDLAQLGIMGWMLIGLAAISLVEYYNMIIRKTNSGS